MNGIVRWMVSILALAALLGYGGFAHAQTSQTMNPATCVDDASIGSATWSNPANAEVSDGAYASATLNGSSVLTTHYIKCTGYGFTIPSGATITGVTVNVQRFGDSSNHFQDAAMRLVNAGAIGATDRSTTTLYPTSDTYEAHGGSTDLWGGTWAPSDINNANFGAAFAAVEVNSSRTHTVYVDNIQITVNYTVPFSCTPPSNIPSGVTVSCVCDNFGRTTLNPSTIFGSNWIVSTSDQTGILPSIVNQGYLQLTNNTGNNAKAATVPGIFPAAGNYISVEFQHYAYNSTSGTGADGVAVTLSDYSVPAVPGAFGGSLGYAQKTGTACNTTSCPGFAGGWIGVALDEYGNYQNPTEGRIGGVGFVPESVGLRGSGSGINGYNYLAGTSSLGPAIDDPASVSPGYGYYYQVVVDARNDPTSTAVSVNRDTGSGYSNLISIPNVYSAATAQGFTQSAVPANWQISFTGSTGGDNNIHAIGGLRICAQSVEPPSGGTAGSFNAIDSAYGNASVSPGIAVQNYLSGHIYMKVTGNPFALNVAALSNSQILTTYAASSAKTVTVRLVDNSDSISNSALDCTLSCTSTCLAKSTVSDATASQTLTFASGATNKGQQQTGNFTLNKAWQKLVAIISDGTTSACSTDVFSVRPPSLTISAANSGGTALAASTAGATGAPTVAAGVNFTINANTGVVQYTGTPSFNFANASDFISGASPLTLLSGNFNPANAATGNASGANFQYNDVGYFVFNANTVNDSTWSTVDQGAKNDCNSGSVSNSIDASGKYGCNIGSNALTGGRFIPDHFDTVVTPSICLTPPCTPANGLFTYSGQPFTTQVIARNAAGATTQNYTAAGYAKAVTLSAWNNITNSSANPGPGALANTNVAASTFAQGVATVATPTYTFTAQKTAPTTIYLGAVDTDGVTSLRTAPLTVEGQTLIQSGRTVVVNAYGSPSVPLPMNVLLQYWTSAGNWAPVLNDNVTAFNTNIAPTGNVVASGYSPAAWGTVGTTQPVSGQRFYNSGRSSGTQGQAVFILAAPNASGSVNLNLNTPSWLPSVAGRATFGIFAGSPAVIYLREIY